MMELLVAFLITSVVLLASYAGFAAAIDARTRGPKALDPSFRSAHARRTLTTWIEGAFVSSSHPDRLFTGINAGEAGYRDVFSFLTTSPVPYSSRSTYVTISVVDEPDRRGLVASLLNLESGTTSEIIMVPWARGFDVTFWSNGVWHDSWASAVNLPDAVRLHVITESTDSISRAMALPIIINLLTGG